MVQPHHLMPGLITEECQWAYPKEESFKENMRYVVKNKNLLKTQTDTLASYLKENFSIEVVKQKYQDFMRTQIQKDNEDEREVVYL
jgi:glycosyltransferase involved in cell wall biosynthesis